MSAIMKSHIASFLVGTANGLPTIMSDAWEPMVTSA